MDLPEAARATRYANMIKGWEILPLLEALESAAKANSYGSHVEQIAILRAEITSRVSA